jgi:RNA polymerase sigma factor (sigma-70 family)
VGHLPDTRNSLLRRLADPEDQVAWDEFVAIYRNAVLGYCRSRGLQDADADEVLQNVLVVVHRRIAGWKPSGRSNSFRVWLLRTAHRQCLKAIRAKARIPVAEEDFALDEIVKAESGDCEALKQDWQHWAFQWAAQQIQLEVEPLTWQAFWRTAVQQTPAEIVAKELNIKVGTVYTNKCRVLNKLRQRVESLTRGE